MNRVPPRHGLRDLHPPGQRAGGQQQPEAGGDLLRPGQRLEECRQHVPPLRHVGGGVQDRQRQRRTGGEQAGVLIYGLRDEDDIFL